MLNIDDVARMRVEGVKLEPADALAEGQTPIERALIACGYAVAPQQPAANDNRGPYITTYSGRFYMFDPRPEDFTIEDVIHSLSSIKRYTGHGRKEYTVAEHSVHIWRWVKANDGTLDEQLAGLLHDAPEALSGFGDVARPAKNRAPIIKETEQNIWRLAISPKYGLPLEMPDIVHEADNRIIADEMAQNLHEVDPSHDDPLGVTLEYWDEWKARAKFWQAFYVTQCARQQEARRVG